MDFWKFEVVFLLVKRINKVIDKYFKVGVWGKIIYWYLFAFGNIGIVGLWGY